MQSIVTREQSSGQHQIFTRSPRIKAQTRKDKLRLDNKIISIVQASRAKNTEGYSRTSCMLVIPKSICKLAGIKEGTLVSWELSKYEHGVFVIRPIVEPEAKGDSA